MRDAEGGISEKRAADQEATHSGSRDAEGMDTSDRDSA